MTTTCSMAAGGGLARWRKRRRHCVIRLCAVSRQRLALGRQGFHGRCCRRHLDGIENLTGSAYNDSLIGDSNANVLDGGKGDDYLKGGGGADKLEGGDGSDTIAYGDSNFGVYVSLYSGAAFNGTASGDQFDSIENLTGSYQGDMLEGDEYVNTIKGLSGDDVLQGYGDADTIDGGDGIDTVIYGGSVLGVWSPSSW